MTQRPGTFTYSIDDLFPPTPSLAFRQNLRDHPTPDSSMSATAFTESLWPAAPPTSPSPKFHSPEPVPAFVAAPVTLTKRHAAPRVAHPARKAAARACVRTLVLASIAAITFTGINTGSADVFASAPAVQQQESVKTAPVAKPKTMMVVGDSMTAWFNDVPGDPKQGWWSLLAAETGMKATSSAVGASGFLRPGGPKCTESTFGDRLDDIRKAKPDVLVVAGGRNDFRFCPKSNAWPVRSTQQQTDIAIRDYMLQLRSVAKEIGLDQKNIYVMTPWGTRYPAEREWVYPLVKARTLKAGFVWVDLDVLPDALSKDHTHPTEIGNGYLMRQILKNSNLDERFPKPSAAVSE